MVFNHAVNDGGQDEFHREAHFPSVHNNAGGTAHEGVMNHAQQVAEINSPLLTRSLAEVNDHEAFIGCRDVPADEWVRGVNRWNPLEVDIGLTELRADVIDVIRHPAQDRIHNRFSGITTLCVVPVNFLNPLKVGDRHNPDQQVCKTGDVVTLTLHTAVQAFDEVALRAAPRITRMSFSDTRDSASR